MLIYIFKLYDFFSLFVSTRGIHWFGNIYIYFNVFFPQRNKLMKNKVADSARIFFFLIVVCSNQFRVNVPVLKMRDRLQPLSNNDCQIAIFLTVYPISGREMAYLSLSLS